MVFESLVTDVLNRFLGSYLEKLNASQLRLGLLSGNVVLENVAVRTTAFDDFSLPVRVLQGHIGRFTLKIPFKNLYTEPVIAELDGLHILAVPNSEMEYDEEKERLYRREAKQKTLAAIDAMKLQSEITPNDTSDSFLEKLAAQIIKNVQVKVENIHIRYEDRVSVPGLEFSAGLTLKKLAFQTCDDAKNPLSINDESVREFYKNVELDSLAVYWNHNTKSYSHLARGVLRNVMESTIASPEHKPPAYDYIIQPISFDALLHVHMQPEKVNFKVPQLSVDVKFEEIEVSLQRNQYTGAVLFLDSIDRMILQNKFRKYKKSSLSKKPGLCRWKFAYSAVLNEVVFRRRRMWDWSYIKQHRDMVKHYTELWTKKLSKETLKPDELAKIQFYEDELDVLNLTLARQKAEVKKSSKRKSAKQKAESAKQSSGWFSGWFSRGSASSNTAQATTAAGEGGQIIQRVQMEMTPEEKAKLYSAIDYSEDTRRTNFPADYLSAIVNFSLHGLTLTLNNTELSDPRIIRLQLDGVTAKILQRSGDNAFDFSLRLGTLEALGAKKADTEDLPVLISSDTSVSVAGSRDGLQVSLLSVEYSKNPLDRKSDERLRVVAEPLEFIYDADTINRIVDFFKPPADLRLEEISSSVLPTIDEVKAMTTTGLRYMASQRTYTDVVIDVRPSCFILPELGVYKEKCRLILVDLGSVSLRSAPAELALPQSDTRDDSQGQPSTLSGRAHSDERYKQLLQVDQEQLKEQAYDRFQMELSSMQIILVQRGENWRQLRTREDMSNHILRPLKVDLTLRRCIVPKEFGLPLFRIDGSLPLLAVDLTDTVLESLLDIVAHIPLPEADPSLKVPTDPDALLKDVEYFPTASSDNQFLAVQAIRTANAIPRVDSEESTTWYNSEESLDSATSAASSKPSHRTHKTVVNLVTLDSSFRIRKTRLRVFQKSSASSDAILVLSVDEVGAGITLRRWDQEIKAHVNSIKIVVPRFRERDSKEPICLAETSEKTRANNLFSMRLLIVDKVAPNFVTEYEHTRHHLTCDFKTLKVRLHQEAILALITFSNELVQMLSTANEGPASAAPASASTADYEAEWARRLGDKEGMRSAQERKLELQPTHTDIRLMDSQTTPMEAVTGIMSRKDERRQIRLDAAFRAAAAGQYVRIPEIDITQWKIQVTLEKLKVVLCSDKLDLLSFSVRGLRVDLSITYMATEVAVALSDVCVSDLNPDTIYKQLLWIDPSVNIFLMQLVIYSRGTNYPEHANNPNKFDMAVSLQLGKAHMVVLYRFVQRVMTYLEAFQTATKYAIDKASELSGAAMQQMQEAVNNPPPGRIALAINVSAPVIYLPQHSHSSRALVFDLGSIALSNHFERLPVPSKGPDAFLMMEMTNVLFEDLRMSAALLMDGGIKAERHVILPINLQISLKRKVVASMDDGIPLLEVTGVLECIHLQVTHGDYQLINDVMTDNFAEGQSIGAPSTTVVSPSLPEGQPTGTAAAAATTAGKRPPPTKKSNVVAAVTADSSPSPKVHDKALQFDFVLKKIDIELFSGSNSMESWADKVNEDRNLGLFNCTKLGVKGHMNKDCSADIAVYLSDVSLQDTRLVAKQHITQILSQTNQSEKSNVISVTFKQDEKENKDIDIGVCSMQICASLDYFMLLLNFFVEGTPTKTEPTAQHSGLPSKPINTQAAPSSNKMESRKWTMRLHGHIEEPEFVLVEDMSDPNCNAVVLSTSLVLDYSMMEGEDVINASIKDFKVVACPFNREDRAENTKNVITPTSIFFYARKPLDSYLRGTVNMESLLINMNPSIIQSISKIVSSLSESAVPSVGGTGVGIDADSLSPSHQFHPDDQFWAEKPIELADLPTLTPISANQRQSSVANVASSSSAEGCDVAKLITEADQRREEKILVHVDYICLLMESQIGAKQMPMLTLEATVDGEIISPSSCLAATMTLEMAVSYYNDHINEWEQLLETLPQENNRFWSLQLEFTSGDPQSLFSEEEWSNLANLQTASRTLSITSQDNLEITVSKTALDVLSKLGASFEDAYRSPARTVSPRASVGIDAPYILQNQTGLDLAVIIDGRRLRMVKQAATPPSAAASSAADTKPDAVTGSGLVCRRISKFETVGFMDAVLEKGPSVRGLRTSQIPPPRSLSVTLAPEDTSSADMLNESGTCAALADRSSSLRIHRTAHYLFMASRPSLSGELVYQVPLVANISAFLGQKTLSIESTVQLVNETPDSITIYSRRSPSGRFEPTYLTELEGGQAYCVPVEVVTNTEITGLLFGAATQRGKCSTDVLYWPETACPLPPGSPARGEAAVYLSAGSANSSSSISLITFGDSNATERWPVQHINFPGVDSAGRSRTFNYTVTVSPRFEDEPQFVQPRPPSSVATAAAAPSSHKRSSLVQAPVPATDPPKTPIVQGKGGSQPRAYRLLIQTPASLHNLLPVPVIFETAGIENEVQPGHHAVLCSVQSTGFSFKMSFFYDEKDYTCTHSVSQDTPELSMISFEAREGYDVIVLNLGLRCSRRPGHMDMTVYSPYWMVNKTGLKLAYKFSRSITPFPRKSKDHDLPEIVHPADFPGVLMFSAAARSFFGESKVLLRAEASAWSSSFSLDIVGSWGRVHCEDSEDKSYEIAVKIDLSSSGLTKIITFMPYFMIVNKSPIPIECAQVRDTSEGAPGTWISVPPGGAKPFWPAAVGSKKMFMICRLDSNIITSAFQLYESHTVLLRLDNKYVGLFAEVQTTDEVTVINLQLYQEGMALVKIINNLDSERPLFFFQRGTGQTHKLEAGKRTFYTWDDATKPRQFLYFFEDPGKAKPLDITTDGYNTVIVKKTTYHWVSFLSKLQRTVLFTNNAEEANAAAKAAEMEAIDHEVTLVLQSIGVSLVNNHSCQEVCYISIRSSDIKWNRVKRENRIKPLRPEVSAELEILYNRFLDKLRVGEKCEERVTLPAHIKPPITVDLGQMVMLEPEMCSLQRTFQPGVHLQYRSSPHQMHIHAKVFRIQVDSQHLDSTFPVVFAPFQAPASMDLDSGPKPLVELIALVYRTTDKQVFRFKRLECLIQEMQCQLDQGFLNEMLDFFAGSVPEKDELTGFLVDQRSTEGELLDIPVIKDILRGGKDSIFDFLHVSPIKMHVSFSLVGSSQEGRQTAFHSDVLNLFLQSLGVALTDVQDVVFKLAYFERRACIMSMSKLTSEMTRHYAGQAIKQTYVLLLGLDVIGNPFGVIRGVAQGVEDLFYEPVKGAIIGTEEFAEGVALGVRSLVGHTVGGAAGAVSRITGTLGKGVAALTLDDDYKRRRREQLSRRPANFSAGLAQGGKDLVMGVFDGVTGIVTQPIGGAKKEGVEGFFKGMTKGLVGVFTRPISGVVDFASSSFEGIRRATSTSKEVTPVRPPRFIGLDGVIRPYDLFQAQGNVLLKPFKDTSLPEEYVFHVPLRKPKSVCILTSRRILILGFNDILGSWSCDWQINLAELDGAPTECASGLELKLLKAQRRVFGSSTASKVIEADVDQARRLQAKIVQRLSMEEAS